MYRIGQEELQELEKVIKTRSLFKINDGLQESRQVEQKLSRLFDCKYPIFNIYSHYNYN